MCWYDDLCSCTDDVDELTRAVDLDLGNPDPKTGLEALDFDLGAACQLIDTDCESCQ